MKMCDSKIFVVTGLVFLMLSSTCLSPITLADKNNNVTCDIGFDKGPSSLPVVPLEKTTFIGFDKETLLDDYAYLACVPTAVFQNDEKLYSHPLLFFEDEYKYEEDKERSLNARQGLDYFMEDWMSYCNDELDQMTIINVPMDKVSQWAAKQYIEIEGNNPFYLAKQIALQDWSYSDNAVIAVIEEEYEKPSILTEGEIPGTLKAYDIDKQHFTARLPEIGAAGGTSTFFDVTDKNYKYLSVKLGWSEKTLDYDLQLSDTKLGMLDISMRDFEEQNNKGVFEITGAFIHHYGKWRASITAVPKKSADMKNSAIIEDINNNLKDSLKSMVRTITNTGDLDITFYPGTIVKLPKTPFGCRDINFKLEWSHPNIRLGFTVLDPSGSEIVTSIPTDEITSGEIKKGINEEELHVSLLGETGENENYSVCIFSLDSINSPIDFTLKYDWKQNYTKKEGECLASASNGAVLASKLNAPLLYVAPSDLNENTKDALYKLGVKKIFLVNLGDHLKNKVKEEIKEITNDITEYKQFEDIYDELRIETDEKTIVFTVMDPWTYWFVKELKPEGEYPGARFIGPASYIASHHNCPVIIIENHPPLSQSIVYHTDFWSSPYYKQHRDEASSGNMMISSNLVYEFLEEYNLGKLEKKSIEQQIREKIIIVAGQYDIGMSWDRSLTGAALQGRFMFSPVDTAYWISRNIFYPALIFENPAMQGTNKYINGSKSEAQGITSWIFSEDKKFIESMFELGVRLKDPKGVNIVQTKPSQEEEFEFPVLMTFNTYAYRFNQKASDHWGTYYIRADGVIPSITDSPDPIDDGAVPDKSGQFYPDLSESEVVPFYANRAGYGSVFSTAFEPVVENLNRGVIIWVENCHGWHPDGGLITLWNPDFPHNYEENPWRSYEPILLAPGSIRDTIHYITETPSLIDLHLLPKIGSTENPDVAQINPQLRVINKILRNINSPFDFWGAFGVMIHRDRILHPLKTLQDDYSFINWYDGDGKVTISRNSGSAIVELAYNSTQWDDALDNLHSVGLNTISCLPAGTYLQLTWIRHGMTWQILDPWTTTDWAGTWTQMLMKWFAMGDTVGEAYERGMRACGPEYSVGHFWWDIWENVCYYGDPDLRAFVPGTEYSDGNYWTQDETQPIRYDEELTINGHMPFGATSYPHEKEPLTFLQQYLVLMIAIALIVILVIVAVYLPGKKK